MDKKVLVDERFEGENVVKAAEFCAFVDYIVTDTEINREYRSVELHSRRQADSKLL